MAFYKGFWQDLKNRSSGKYLTKFNKILQQKEELSIEVISFYFIDDCITTTFIIFNFEVILHI